MNIINSAYISGERERGLLKVVKWLLNDVYAVTLEVRFS